MIAFLIGLSIAPLFWLGFSIIFAGSLVGVIIMYFGFFMALSYLVFTLIITYKYRNNPSKYKPYWEGFLFMAFGTILSLGIVRLF